MSVLVWLLRKTFPEVDLPGRGVYAGKSKLRMLLGENAIRKLQNKTVVDYGCGQGLEAIELAQSGCRFVVGYDIDDESLMLARGQAQAALDNIAFVSELPVRYAPFDAIVSLDAFEHFARPEEELKHMRSLLVPGGAVYFSFGPPWYHPNGGHLFSVFPWAHLLLSERALCAWRRTLTCIPYDGASRFSEVKGGLNQMTIRKFAHLVAHSGFQASYEMVPIREFGLRFLHNRLTREFTTSIVRGKLVKE